MSSQPAAARTTTDEHMRALLARIAIAALVWFAALPASAHPHVWITTKAELVYAPDGRLTAVRHLWTFDEGYSAYVTEGIIEDGKLEPIKAHELAQTNVESLADNGYFTDLRVSGTKQDFAPPSDPDLAIDGKRLTLRFTLPLKTPAKPARALLNVYDPTFFIDFTVADGQDALTLSGAPPGCLATVQRPKAAPKSEKGNLSEALFQALTSPDYGAQVASKMVVTCP